LCYNRDQEAILSDLRVDLALQFDFLFSATHVEVISGKQEGIYSWIAVNHALGKFDHFLHSGCGVSVVHFVSISLCISEHVRHTRRHACVAYMHYRVNMV